MAVIRRAERYLGTSDANDSSDGAYDDTVGDDGIGDENEPIDVYSPDDLEESRLDVALSHARPRSAQLGRARVPALRPWKSRLWDVVQDHWGGLLGGAVAIATVGIVVYHFGLVGLLLAPFVIVLALVILWLLLYLVAFASFIYAIVSFVQQDYLTGALFLSLSALVGTIVASI